MNKEDHMMTNQLPTTMTQIKQTSLTKCSERASTEHHSLPPAGLLQTWVDSLTILCLVPPPVIIFTLIPTLLPISDATL